MGKTILQMKRIHLIYFALIGSIILLVYDILELDFNNIEAASVISTIAMVLIILSMLFSLKDINNKKDKTK